MNSSEMLGTRIGAHEMSERAYLFVIGLFTVAGLALTAVMASLTYGWKDPNWLVILLIGLPIPIAGIFLSSRSSDWVISTIGYLMVVVPFGIILGPTVALYKLPSVISVIMITTCVTAVMWAIGTAIPAIVKDLSGYIVGALLVLIAGNVIGAIMPMFGMKPAFLTWWAWLGAFLFAGLILYDINKALQIPRTMDNAVDAVVGIYLDVINLFLELLRIFGTKKDD